MRNVDPEMNDIFMKSPKEDIRPACFKCIQYLIFTISYTAKISNSPQGLSLSPLGWQLRASPAAYTSLRYLNSCMVGLVELALDLVVHDPIKADALHELVFHIV